MSAKTPIRTVFDGSNNATGLAEFQSGEFIGLTHGGLGASLSIGSAGQVLKVNSGASALEFGTVEAVFNIDGMTDGSGITIADGDDFAISDAGTEKKINASQIATYVQSGISGDVTISSGTAAIGSGVIVNADVNASAAIAVSKTALTAGTGISLSTNTLNVDAAQTGITSLLATDIKIGEDNETKIDFETADEIHFYAANAEQVFVSDGVFGPQTDSDVDLGTTSNRFKDAFMDSVTVTGNLAIGGNFTVNGTTSTVNSTTVTIDDPIFTLGGDGDASSDDNKDRGIEFKYHTGSAAKLGFFGFDDSTGKFTFIPDATNSSEVFSGTAGTVVASTFEGNLTGNVTGNVTGNITGNAEGTAATVTGAAQSNITSLGTLTTLTVDNVIVNGTTIGHTDDTDLMTLADGVLTVAGEVDAVSLDVSGDADIDGTLEADAITVGGVTLAEVISDTVGAMVTSNTESGITVAYQDADNTLDFTIGTLNQNTTGSAATLTTARTIGGTSFDGSANIAVALSTAATTLETARTIAGVSFDGSANIAIASTDLTDVTSTAAELNFNDGVTLGTAIASKTVTTDSNKDTTGQRNLTITGELDAATLDISGNADIDGTLEADAITIGGVSLAETISDTVGAMVSSNTETNITVAYQDADNTLDFTIGTLNQNTTGSAATLTTARTIGGTSFDGSANIAVALSTAATTLETARTIAGVSFDGSANIAIASTDLTDVTSTAAELNFNDGVTLGTAIASKTVTTDSNKDTTGQRNLTITGELDAATLDISGNADIDGTLEADAITIGGVSLAETISDTVGAMVSSNTETNITVTYQDADNTLDFAIGTLNQDTTGSAATLTTARTIAGQSFDGSANIAIASTDLSNTSAIALLTASQTMTNKTLTSPQINTQIDMLARAEMRFQDASGGQYVALEAPATVSSNVTFTLPAADGDADQVIVTDGSGALSFADAGGGAGGFSASTIVVAPGQAGDFALTKTNNAGDEESGFETGATDVFGVAIGSVFDLMEPVGAGGTTTDFGAF